MSLLEEANSKLHTECAGHNSWIKFLIMLFKCLFRRLNNATPTDVHNVKCTGALRERDSRRDFAVI